MPAKCGLEELKMKVYQKRQKTKIKANFVTKELHQGVWVATYFETMAEAKKLFSKILRAGGVAICLRSAR